MAAAQRPRAGPSVLLLPGSQPSSPAALPPHETVRGAGSAGQRGLSVLLAQERVGAASSTGVLRVPDTHLS